MRNFKSQNQVLHKSRPVFSNDPINTHHIHIPLTGTDQFNSNLSKVIQFEKKQSLSFLNFKQSLGES